MKDRICLVTGASSGLGKATALSLAKLGGTVILGCRNQERGRGAQEEVRNLSGNNTAQAMVVDLAVQKSVRNFAGELEKRYGRLDVLINNAAVFKQKRTLTPDGFETMFATNHLGPFLLTSLLLNLMKASSPARIINIAAPSTVKLDFENLQGERKFNALGAFGASKMCNILFTYELARRLEGTGVTANVVHPGLVRSGLMGEAPFPIRGLTRLISRSPEIGAAAVAYVASSPEVEGQTGQFFKRTKVSSSDPYSRDTDVQNRLWDVSVKLTGLDAGS